MYGIISRFAVTVGVEMGLNPEDVAIVAVGVLVMVVFTVTKSNTVGPTVAVTLTVAVTGIVCVNVSTSDTVVVVLTVVTRVVVVVTGAGVTVVSGVMTKNAVADEVVSVEV